MSKLYSATELADDLGITARAIRFYETKGLLQPQRVGTTRAFTYRDRARLKLILRGKRLGFTLSEIKDYLELYVMDRGQNGQLVKLAGLVHERIEQLEQQREDIAVTLSELREIAGQVKAAMNQGSPDPQ